MAVNMSLRHSSTRNSSRSSGSEDERLHQAECRRNCMARAINQNTVYIVKFMPFKECENADIVVQACITEDECETIRNLPCRSDQIRTLLRKVTKRSLEAMVTLVNIIGTDNQDLYHKIMSKYHELLDHHQDSSNVPCVVCQVMNNVDIKDVCDYFIEKELVSEDLHMKVTECNSKAGAQTGLWHEFFVEIDGHSSEEIMHIMIKALSDAGNFHENIVIALKRDIAKRREFKCRCKTSAKTIKKTESSARSPPCQALKQLKMPSCMPSTGTDFIAQWSYDLKTRGVLDDVEKRDLNPFEHTDETNPKVIMDGEGTAHKNCLQRFQILNETSSKAYPNSNAPKVRRNQVQPMTERQLHAQETEHSVLKCEQTVPKQNTGHRRWGNQSAGNSNGTSEVSPDFSIDPIHFRRRDLRRRPPVTDHSKYAWQRPHLASIPENAAGMIIAVPTRRDHEGDNQAVFRACFSRHNRVHPVH